MLPVAEYQNMDAIQELNLKVNVLVIHAALHNSNATYTDNCGTDGFTAVEITEQGSLHRDYALTEDNKSRIEWISGLVPAVVGDTVWQHSQGVTLQYRRRITAGLDLAEHPVYLDAEECSAEFASRGSYSSNIPNNLKKVARFLR